VGDEPDDHVRELASVLEALDVLDLLEHVGFLAGVESGRVPLVEGDVVADERVRPEPDVLESPSGSRSTRSVHDRLDRSADAATRSFCGRSPTTTRG
jgi:hypothetical protein